MIQANFHSVYCPTYKSDLRSVLRMPDYSTVKRSDDEEKDGNYGCSSLAMSPGTVKAVVKPSTLKSFWNGIKKFFGCTVKTVEQKSPMTLEEIQKCGETTYNIYDTVNKIQNNPNWNYQPPQNVQV